MAAGQVNVSDAGAFGCELDNGLVCDVLAAAQMDVVQVTAQASEVFNAEVCQMDALVQHEIADLWGSLRDAVHCSVCDTKYVGQLQYPELVIVDASWHGCCQRWLQESIVRQVVALVHFELSQLSTAVEYA